MAKNENNFPIGSRDESNSQASGPDCSISPQQNSSSEPSVDAPANQHAAQCSDADDTDPQPSKTELSTKLDRLKSATLKVVHARERLPQPLFWSLFHAELESIKQKRKKQREMLAALYNIDWL